MGKMGADREKPSRNPVGFQWEPSRNQTINPKLQTLIPNQNHKQKSLKGGRR